MEQWVTPGRFKVPHLQTTFDAATGTWSIGEVNTNPYNYPTLSVDSQAYKNIHEGIPTDFNQFEGCPVGHKMGPDGVCRPITGYQGPGLPEIGLPVEPTPDDPTPDPNDPFQENKYNYRGELKGQPEVNDPYKDYMASVGTNKFYSTGNDYSALPGGMNNWTDEAFYDWGLDKGYITTSEVGGPMESKLKFSIFSGLGQMMNDKKFQWWFDSAQKRGILKASYDTEGELEGTELLKTRGEGDGFGGGGLIDITKETKDTAESTWNNIVKTTILPSQYLERTVTEATDIIPNMEKSLDDKATLWWYSTMWNWLDGKHDYTDKDRYDNTYPSELNELAKDFELPSPNFFGWSKTSPQLEPKKFGLDGNAVDEFKEQILKSAREYDKTYSGKGFIETTEDQMFDPLLGEYVKKSTGLSAEAERRRRSKILLDEQQDSLSKIKPKEKPSFAIGTDIGNKAYNITTAQTGSYIGASVYKSPDKASDVGGHYQQNGKFVNSNGQVSSRGSMSDSIYAMANGTAVDSVLDRTLKSNNSYKVMVKEADKMLENKKITQAEYDKVVTYKTKNDYQKNKSNLTIHENGEVTKGSEKPVPKLKGKGPGRGQQRTGKERNQGSSGGNTGSGSKKKDKIICTEMYRQTNLNDWKESMKLWYLFQKKHLTPTHQVGYHFLFKPFVRGMKKSKILTAIGSHFAKQRTKDIKHIMFGTKFSLLGRTYRIIFEPICYVTGLLLTYKEKLAWQ